MRIAITEDHLIFRDVLSRACSADFGHQVVAESDSGSQTLEQIARLRPDVLLLDLRLRDLDGFIVAERALTVLPALRILVISSYINEFTVYQLDRLGVHGFVDKNTSVIEVIRQALRAIEIGKVYFSPSFLAARRAYRANPRSFAKLLSPTEQQVLGLIGRGLDDQEIGERLRITPRTAQTHRSNILRKLRIKGTPKLINFAVEHGFVLPAETRD